MTRDFAQARQGLRGGATLRADVSDRLRYAARTPGPLWVTTSPEWTVYPYAGRKACWGCGLEPQPGERSLGGLLICEWCDELLRTDKANQRRGHTRTPRT
ncbi:hypothetical protein ACFVH6_22000 [Spirillospora sp. NPDC127200]